MWSHISNSFLGAGASYCMAARSRATAVSKPRTLGQISTLVYPIAKQDILREQDGNLQEKVK